MAMAYILMVNANMFSELGVVSYNAIYIATAISAVVGTFLIAFLANLPLGLASGMGLNAFFVYTVCFTFGLSYANALILVLLDGVVFIILTLPVSVRCYLMLSHSVSEWQFQPVSVCLLHFWDYRMRELLFLQALPVST